MENDRVNRLKKIYTKYFTKVMEEIELEQRYSKEDIQNINYRGWSTFIKYMNSPAEVTKNLIEDFKNELLEITTGIPTRRWYHNIGNFIYNKSLWAGSAYGSYYIYNMYNYLKETIKKTAIESKNLVNSIAKSISYPENLKKIFHSLQKNISDQVKNIEKNIEKLKISSTNNESKIQNIETNSKEIEKKISKINEEIRKIPNSQDKLRIPFWEKLGNNNIYFEGATKKLNEEIKNLSIEEIDKLPWIKKYEYLYDSNYNKNTQEYTKFKDLQTSLYNEKNILDNQYAANIEERRKITNSIIDLSNSLKNDFEGKHLSELKSKLDSVKETIGEEFIDSVKDYGHSIGEVIGLDPVSVEELIGNNVEKIQFINNAAQSGGDFEAFKNRYTTQYAEEKVRGEEQDALNKFKEVEINAASLNTSLDELNIYKNNMLNQANNVLYATIAAGMAYLLYKLVKYYYGIWTMESEIRSMIKEENINLLQQISDVQFLVNGEDSRCPCSSECHEGWLGFPSWCETESEDINCARKRLFGKNWTRCVPGINTNMEPDINTSMDLDINPDINTSMDPGKEPVRRRRKKPESEREEESEIFLYLNGKLVPAF